MTTTQRTALITGASRGIGEGIACELGAAGMNVAVNYRGNEDAAHAVVSQIRATGTEAIAVQADVTNRAAVDRMITDIHDAFGPVDVLVNNAGVTIDTTFDQMSRDAWDQVIEVNLGGMFNCTKACYEDLRTVEHGRLINISSVVGEQGNYGQANYATTKSGMFGFTRTIALELARTQSTANCVTPGFTQTPMLEKVPDEVKSKILDRIPLGRFASVSDVAGIVRFLASEDSGYMTGQVIGINGGMAW